jgi:hypothetical protein
MKIILTESQFGRLNKSSQQITNAIIKYMNEGIMPSTYEEKYTLINEQEVLL